jgi:hypothetical protein
MKYISTYEIFESLSKEIDIYLICDIFSHIMDDNVNVWIWQFPLKDEKRSSHSEVWTKLTYTGTKEDKLPKLVPNKEYWFELEAKIDGKDLTNTLDREKITEVGNIIKNYDYASITDRLEELGLTIDDIVPDFTNWAVTPSMRLSSFAVSKVKIIMRLL